VFLSPLLSPSHIHIHIHIQHILHFIIILTSERLVRLSPTRTRLTPK
jgi:hypothetical protein